MEEHNILLTIIVLMGTAISVVAIFKQLNLSPVLGYLVAGALIGDHGGQWVRYDQISFLGEFGVVFLLFAIGLELSFERLKAMRKYVFGLGTLQVFITAVIVGFAAMYLLGDKPAAIIIGGGLALSSTAIVLQVIEENRSQSSQLGRVSIAILLLQDFIVVPLLVVLPLLAGTQDSSAEMIGGPFGAYFVRLLEMDGRTTSAMILSGLFSIFIIVIIFVIGRTILRRVFSVILTNQRENGELATAVTLVIVLSAAFGTESLGMSFALGAFMSGVLVAETDFRIRAEHSIYPFKSLLLGLFFMSVGMKIDVEEIYANLSVIIAIFSSLMIVKMVIITLLCMIFGFNKPVSLQAGMLLSQGGEFAFILFGLGKDQGILDETTATILLLSVTCSMALTPLLASLGKKIASSIGESSRSNLETIKLGCMDLANHVIIAGFGKVGKMVARFLEAEGINYIVIDIDDEVVREEFKGGVPIFTGDMSKPSVLEAASAETAFAVILGFNNEITIKRSIKNIQKLYPNLNIIMRLSNISKMNEFYDAGVAKIIPEPYEIGLQLGGEVLKSMGISEHEINRMKSQFRSSSYSKIKSEDDLASLESES